MFSKQLSLLPLALLTPVLLTAQNTWTGDESGLWNVADNWDPGVPSSNENTELIFGESDQTTVENTVVDFQFGDWLFTEDAPAYTIEGTSFRTRGPVINNSSATQTFDTEMRMQYTGGTADNPSFGGSGDIILNGFIWSHAGSTNANLVKSGSGTLTLTNNTNTFLGTLMVHEGTLRLGNSNVADGASLVSLAVGTTLEFAAGVPDQTFYLPGLTAASDRFTVEKTTLVLEDTNGDAVHLVLTSSGNQINIWEGISGSGSMGFGTGENHSLFTSHVYTGGTEIFNNTTVNLSTNGALGSGDIRIADTSTLVVAHTHPNNILISGGNVEQLVGQTSALTLRTTGAVRSDFTDGVTTQVELLASTGNAAGSVTTLYSFAEAATAVAANDDLRRSDVFQIGETGTSRVFVLQLSVDSLDTISYLGIFNPVLGEWVEAVESNYTVGDPALAGFYEMSWANFLADNGGSFNDDSMLGAHGYDADNNAVWAVLNYGVNDALGGDFGGMGDFAIVAIPEPATMAAILGALALGLAFWRRTRAGARVMTDPAWRDKCS